MRARPLLLALIFTPCTLACAQPRQAIPKSPVASLAAAPAAKIAVPEPARLPAPHVDFARQIQPILAARCQPCHFPGGKMYASLPFDRPETTLRLREKLFTRLKDENERHTIRAFLAEHPAPSGGNGTILKR